MVGNLTVIVPFFNGHKYIEKLVQTIPQNIPILIVDDLSDESLYNRWNAPNKLTEGAVKVIRLQGKGYFAGAVNAGIQACTTDVLVLNQDTWFDDERAFELIDDLRNEGFAYVGERIRGNHPAFGDQGYIHGTFMFLRRDAIVAVGLLNEALYPLWGGTAEYQWRVARKGFAVKPIPEIPGFHHEREENQRYGESIQQLMQKSSDVEKRRFSHTPPLLSVIVPCFNYGRYLKDCIASLIGGETSLGLMEGQTLQSFEVIIVNDASTDDSAKYIAQVENLAQGIRAYHLEKNVGTAEALNFGIRKAIGKYITFLSADDMRESFSLEKLVQACEQNPHSFAYDDVWIVHERKRVRKWPMQEYNFEELLWKNHIHAGIVFPKQAWEEVGGYPAIMRDGREDWAFNVALGIKGWCGVHVKQLGYLYRRENQNRSATNTTAAHRDVFLKKLKSLFPTIYGGHRPMPCCGGGNKPRAQSSSMRTISNPNKLSTTTLMKTGGTVAMATSVGVSGMVQLEYLGKQQSTIWDGPVTRTRYRFGVDRKVGWVDPRDVGVEGKEGFLGLKDRNNNLLFRKVDAPVAKAVAAPAEEPALSAAGAGTATATLVADEGEVLTVVADEEAEEDAVSATIVQQQPETHFRYNPSEMYPSDIKRLNLTHEEWGILYRLELAGKNRKTVTTYIEEQLASE